MKVETLSQSSDLVQNHEEVCCAICIDNFEAGAVVRHLTCAHVYHKKVQFGLQLGYSKGLTADDF